MLLLILFCGVLAGAALAGGFDESRLHDARFTIATQRERIASLMVAKSIGLTINAMTEQCLADATAKGWADKVVTVPEQIALIHSEASEALEEYRNGKPVSYTVDGKPEGIGPEFADILIRIGHYSKLNGIDLEAEVLRKMAFNRTREYRHGGKAI